MKVKRHLQYYAFLVLLLCTSSTMLSQQITVDSSIPVDQLVLDNLIKGCVQISNITSSVNGNSYGVSSYGYFNKASSNFPFQDGVMLSTGNAESGGNGVRTPTLSEGSTIWGTDNDLETALGITNTLNATSIEFDLVSSSNLVQFNYLLASEEYFGINPCQFSDGFAFLIKETASAGPYQNIAVVPGTSTPVNTNTIHDEIYGVCPAQNDQYFDGYNVGDTNFNGRTVPLTASANIVPYVQYHIKLIIADQTDLNYDSAVFIEGISFDNLNLGDDIVTCLNSTILDADIQNPQASYTWFLNGNPINGQTSSSLNATQDGVYKVEISVPLNNNTCLLEDEIQVTLNSEPPVDPISDYLLCDDLSGDATEIFDLQTKNTEILSSLPPANYNNLKYYYNESDARSGINPITTPISNTSNPQQVFVAIENLDTGCFSYAPINLVVNLIPNIATPSTLEVCDNDATPNGITDINLTLKDSEIANGQANVSVSYHFTQADALTGNNPIISPYVNASSPNSESFFVRATDTLSSCFNVTTLDVNITNSPIINRDTQYIDACDTDHDSFASFDLTEVIPNVLDGLSPTGLTIAFHETFDDAESGSNPIPNPTNYLNTAPDVQTVFIRVQDDSTGCPTIVPIEVHTNLLLTGTNIEDFALCDDAANDGIADFYLNIITTQIANELPNIDVIYYENETDLINNNTANALDPGVPYTATSPQILYINIENTATGCNEQAEIKLLVNPILLFEPVTPLQYCDDNDDGIVNVDLHSLDETVNSGNTNFEVHYFLTQQDAEDNSNELPPLYPVSGSTTLFARIVNVDSGCRTVNSFDISIVPAPTISQPSDFIICDDDQDGFSTINLESKIPEIVADTTGLTISFFTSLNDAESGSNRITNPGSYSSNTQNIYVRIASTSSSCYTIATISVIVSTKPVFPTIIDYEICEDDGDGKAEFLLSDKDNEILNGQAGKEVFYFEDSNYTIPIDKNTLYTNISSPQTIYVRVQNTIDPSCYGDSSFTIVVSSNPDYNINFKDYLVCDDISNDGKNVFDLNEKIAEISQGATNPLNISFYSTRQNAEDKLNPLPMQYTNVTNPQTIYVRIEGNNSICYVIEDLGINIIAAPEVSQANPYILCDDDYDGITTFNLETADFQLLDRITTDLAITYFENEEDVEDISKEIANPTNYTNISNPQTVFIKVTNILTGCYSVVPLDLIVNTPYPTNSIGTIEICDNNTNTFDLSQVNNMIVDEPNNVIISYHNSLVEAQANTNILPDTYNYTTSFNTFFVRIEDPNTGCVITPSFNLQINPNPAALAPPSLVGCDDDYDGFLAFDLSQQKNIIIGLENPNDFTVTYYTSQTDADSKTNPLSNLHAAFDGEIIYARMESNLTGCYDTTSFSTIVNPLPIININDVVPLCLNDLPLVIDAGTGNSGDSYLWSTGETTSKIQLQPEDLGDYWVTITSPFNCQATKAFSVIESEEATINMTSTVNFTDPNSITVEVSGIGNYVYILDDGEPQLSNVFDNVTFGLHTVTVRDVNGCQDVSKEVIVFDTPKFMTPNNDGDFDTWHIIGIEQLPGTVVYIYDRYGKLLKTLTSSSPGWDGTFNGHNMPSDDYWFVAKVKKDGLSFDLRGHFALKR
ncbi:choice-of-anchor L domain-containing protein [Yeosuana marina]|uniref:choice-of-anchor L domain-containing protein n=1 Tax=Yeosuana marina TaxID=1565536 RepID=UPI0030EE9BF5